MEKIAIVTGGSGGIGREAARALARKGVRVYEFSRRDVPSDFCTHISCDVTDETQVREAVNTVIHREGRIDILVLCAGMGISGAVEFTDIKESRRQIEVNLFGTDRVVRAALPYMREQRSGSIVIISSVAAVTPIPFQTWYSVSKAALNSYTLALMNEVRPFGIRVSAVLPGDIRTGFTDARRKDEKGDDLYSGRISRSVSRMEKDERGGMSPAVAGEKIARTALKKRSKPISSIGFSYSLVCVLIRILPYRLSQYILYQLYAK